MHSEYRRCAYCEHLESVMREGRLLSACAEAFRLVRDAGFPAGGLCPDGRRLLEIEPDGRAGSLCEAFSLLDRAALEKEFGPALADAAHGFVPDARAEAGLRQGADFPASLHPEP